MKTIKVDDHVSGGNADGQPLYVVQVARSQTFDNGDEENSNDGDDDAPDNASSSEQINGGQEEGQEEGEEDDDDGASSGSSYAEEYSYGMVRVGDLRESHSFFHAQENEAHWQYKPSSARTVWDTKSLLSSEYKVLVYK